MSTLLHSNTQAQPAASPIDAEARQRRRARVGHALHTGLVLRDRIADFGAPAVLEPRTWDLAVTVMGIAGRRGQSKRVPIAHLEVARELYGDFRRDLGDGPERDRHDATMKKRVQRDLETLHAYQAATGLRLVYQLEGGEDRSGNLHKTAYDVPILDVLAEAYEAAKHRPCWRYDKRRAILEAGEPLLAGLIDPGRPTRERRPDARPAPVETATRKAKRAARSLDRYAERLERVTGSLERAAEMAPARSTLLRSMATAVRQAGGIASGNTDTSRELAGLVPMVAELIRRSRDREAAADLFFGALVAELYPDGGPEGDGDEPEDCKSPHGEICNPNEVSDLERGGGDKLSSPPAAEAGESEPDAASEHVPCSYHGDMSTPAEPVSPAGELTLTLELLATAGVERVGVAYLDDRAPKGERRRGWSVFTVREAIANAPAIVRRSARDRESVSLRYQGDDFGGLHGIAHDEDVPDDLAAALSPFALAIVETSPDSNHVLIALADEDGNPLGDERTKAVQERLARRFAGRGVNAGARGAFRAPGTFNWKPERARPDGTAPRVALVSGIPERRFTVRELDEAGLLADPLPTKRPRRPRIRLDESRESKRFVRPDYSGTGGGDEEFRAVFAFLCECSRRGFTTDEAAAMAEGLSEWAARRRPAELKRWAKKARRAAERGRAYVN